MNNGGSLTLVNAIIANNTGGDCLFAVSSLGHNLDSDGTCNLTATGDLSNTDPLLGPLQDNGGPTFTHTLLPGSPAIDAIPLEACTDKDGNPITTDQRGVLRPQGAACDLGAFEFQPPPPTPTPTPIPGVTQWGLVAMAVLLGVVLARQISRNMRRRGA